MMSYPQGGGHWSVRLQYMLGLRALGVDFLWLEVLPSQGDRKADEKLIKNFLDLFGQYELKKHCVVARYNELGGRPSYEDLEFINCDKKAFRRLIDKTDVLWNFHCSMREPLLSLFPRKALLDLDPGHLQASALHRNLDIQEHDVFFTVGTNMNNPDCESPTLGKQWQPFLPPIFLPAWSVNPAPSPDAPFTSVTQWNWGNSQEIRLGVRLLNVGKRDAYLRYIEIPNRVDVPFELAANIKPSDQTGDIEMLKSNGWRLVSPHELATTPAKYQEYILSSRGEFGCAKPVHADLRTGWFSDRSAAFLASGRPVVLEETGIQMGLPTNEGILTFNSLEDAVLSVSNCVSNYRCHAEAARAIAESHLDSDKILTELIESSLAT